MSKALAHYGYSFVACVFAFLWGFQVAQQNAWLATFDVLLVGIFVHGANAERAA